MKIRLLINTSALLGLLCLVASPSAALTCPVGQHAVCHSGSGRGGGYRSTCSCVNNPPPTCVTSWGTQIAAGTSVILYDAYLVYLPDTCTAHGTVVSCGLNGVLINSSHQHAYPDDDEAKPFFELVSSLGIPMMMHAPSVGYGEERMRDYRLASSVGRPFDECLSIARLIVRGVFERFVNLKFVGCHLGGGICDVIGRMDYAYELGDQASGLGSYEPMLISKRPSEYLKYIYMDTVAYHPPAVMCAYQTVGAKQLLFGSDAPPLLPLLPRAKQIIEELPLTDDERADIFARNALRLLERR